jgi:hypothetical protein
MLKMATEVHQNDASVIDEGVELDVELGQETAESHEVPKLSSPPITPPPKLPVRKDEPIHPRAQQKLDELRRRGFIP